MAGSKRKALRVGASSLARLVDDGNQRGSHPGMAKGEKSLHTSDKQDAVVAYVLAVPRVL